jgi:hypothetical protein
MKKGIIGGLLAFAACFSLFSQQIIHLDETKAFDLGQLMEKKNVLFVHPQDVDLEGESLFILDSRFCHILKVNTKTGTLEKLISSRGQGPAELSQPMSLRVKGNLVYVGDRGYGGIKIFNADDGYLLRALKINASMDDIEICQNGDLVLKKADSISNSLICEFDREGQKVRDLVPLDMPSNEKLKADYFRDTYIRFRLDPEENLILLYPMKREVLKYDKKGELLWRRAVDNPVLKESAASEDEVRIGKSGSVSYVFNVFNVAIDGKGNIIVGHNGGGQVFSPFGDSLLVFKGLNLNTFVVSGDKLVSVLPQGDAYIFKIQI